MPNEYEPWKEAGQTELEYFKARYIEARQELQRAIAYISTVYDCPGTVLCDGCRTNLNELLAKE